eukprot:NODE_3226_length_1007_cov_28.247727_g3080_i0.p1 GENE.NODE_3226_length_1007_cov_28.247727_g3080_i0~~NODE_3226_length_1007_cov_28.247727_g3080_i0.p1  ORF type:complete len:295 (-),score=99.52 NODE_3226_length_1007_cov_28.247727_g3080_i0:100-984(-)
MDLLKKSSASIRSSSLSPLSNASCMVGGSLRRMSGDFTKKFHQANDDAQRITDLQRQLEGVTEDYLASLIECESKGKELDGVTTTLATERLEVQRERMEWEAERQRWQTERDQLLLDQERMRKELECLEGERNVWQDRRQQLLFLTQQLEAVETELAATKQEAAGLAAERKQWAQEREELAKREAAAERMVEEAASNFHKERAHLHTELELAQQQVEEMSHVRDLLAQELVTAQDRPKGGHAEHEDKKLHLHLPWQHESEEEDEEGNKERKWYSSEALKPNFNMKRWKKKRDDP